MSDERPQTIISTKNGERWRILEPYGAAFETVNNGGEQMVEFTSYEEDAPHTPVSVKASSVEVIYEISDERWEIDQRVATERHAAEAEMMQRARMGAGPLI